MDLQTPKAQPPYEIGDVLWAKEAWFQIGDKFYYRTDGECRPEGTGKCWILPDVMPKEAARFFIRVLDIFPQKLKGFTNYEAMQEGFLGVRCWCWPVDTKKDCVQCGGSGWLIQPYEEFEEYWDARALISDHLEWIFENNPWVWVIEFEQCEKPDDWPKGEGDG